MKDIIVDMIDKSPSLSIQSRVLKSVVVKGMSECELREVYPQLHLHQHRKNRVSAYKDYSTIVSEYCYKRKS